MDAFARAFPADPGSSVAPPKLQDLVAALRLASPFDLANPALGEPIQTARSSWVRRVRSASVDCHIKTYEYRRLRDRWRGLLRNTGPCTQSRARREAAALRWLHQNGFAAPSVVGVLESRRFGVLTRAILVTTTWPGQPLHRLLPALPRARQERAAEALGQFVAALHGAGFRDPNLDLRNILASAVGDQYVLTKIDSPRFRIVRAGPAADARSRADWARLSPQLQALGLAGIAERAAQRPVT